MGKSVTEIKVELEQSSGEELQTLLALYREDSRKGVQALVKRYHKKEEDRKKEIARLEAMRCFERKYGDRYHMICGIDEAGRGPLAGPVVAGAVILPEDCEILYLNDSKKLSAAKREQLYEEITKKAVAYGVGMRSPERIDEINILQATYEAMQDAVGDLKVSPDLLLVDAVTIPKMEVKQVGIVKGDAKSVSIAAASIIAKVTRDRLMMEMDSRYPGYGFAQNKGYGSAAHMEAIKKLGPCPIHRKSFIKNL